MSEVDFMYVVISHPNWSKPPFCIIEYEPIMKNVERKSIFLKNIFRSRIITWIYRDIDLIWVKWILQRLLYDFQIGLRFFPSLSMSSKSGPLLKTRRFWCILFEGIVESSEHLLTKFNALVKKLRVVSKYPSIPPTLLISFLKT